MYKTQSFSFRQKLYIVTTLYNLQQNKQEKLVITSIYIKQKCVKLGWAFYCSRCITNLRICNFKQKRVHGKLVTKQIMANGREGGILLNTFTFNCYDFIVTIITKKWTRKHNPS